MKVGIVDMLHLVWPKFKWVTDAMRRCGHDVVEIKNADVLRERLNECDLYLFSQRPPVSAQGMRELRGQTQKPWIAWVFDLLGHYTTGQMLLDEIDWPSYQFVFAKNLEPLKQRGIPCDWLDQACPPWPIKETRKDFDVAIVGRWSERRSGLVDACLSRRLSVIVAGDGPEWKKGIECGKGYRYIGAVWGDDSQNVFRRARVTIGDNLGEPIAGYWSDRMWLAIACDSVYVGPHVDGLRESVGAWDTYEAQTFIVDTPRQAIAKQIAEVDHDEVLKQQAQIRERHQYKDRVEQMMVVLRDRGITT